MEQEQEKKTWGGARKGAGRKHGDGVRTYSFSATQQVHEILQNVKGSKRDFINRCIIQATAGNSL